VTKRLVAAFFPGPVANVLIMLAVTPGACPSGRGSPNAWNPVTNGTVFDVLVLTGVAALGGRLWRCRSALTIPHRSGPDGCWLPVRPTEPARIRNPRLAGSRPTSYSTGRGRLVIRTTTSGLPTGYPIFAGLGLLPLALGLFDVIQGLTTTPAWTVFGRDSDVVAGIALIRSGLMGIVAARRYYLRRS
jgi:hypothetical protein